MKTTKFKLERVKYMPKDLQPEVLYVSEEYETAAHLCACGCGVKVRTPLDVTEWTFTNSPEGPSLSPSIGNWQQKCQSHYWIIGGKVKWAEQWSEAKILAGRHRENLRREAYYAKQRPGFVTRVWGRLRDKMHDFLSG